MAYPKRRSRGRMFFGMGAIVFFIARPGWAFVDNVTHGYASCVACHISPSGGGLLTDYGRSLSKELMSTFGWEGSEQPLFGGIRNSDDFKAGGDVRWLQTYFENSQVRRGSRFIMQRNVELGLRSGKTWFVGAAGTQEGPEGTPRKGSFLSERHYALWEPSDDLKVRLGKFRLNFGLYEPNHTRVTKSPLGFGSNSETYALEVVRIRETDELFVASALGRIDIPRDAESERSVSATYARYIGTEAKAGGSLLFGESEVRRRTVVGVFTVFPPFKNAVAKLETDFQRSFESTTPSRHGDLAASYASVGYSPVRGVNPYLFFEYLQRDLSNDKSRETSPGLGVQLLPLAHFELQAEYKRTVLESAPDKHSDAGWFLFHFYL